MQNRSKDRPYPRAAPARDAPHADHAIVGRLLEGDESAGATLLDEHYRKIFGLLSRLCADGDRAADLTQETFRRAWQGLRGYRGDSSFWTWLYRIAYTTFLNDLRRRGNTEQLETVDAARLDAVPDDSEGIDPDRGLGRLEASGLLRRAVLELPEKQRAAIVAHYWGDLSISDIAAREEVTTVAVRKRIAKALAHLRAQRDLTALSSTLDASDPSQRPADHRLETEDRS